MKRPVRSIGFIGAGAVASVLASAMAARGYQLKAVASKGGVSARRLAQQLSSQAVRTPQEVADVCHVVFLAVPDDALQHVAAEIQWRPGQIVVHLSGASSLDVLDPARRQEASVASFHPLHTFVRGGARELPPGTVVAIEASEDTFPFLETLARDLGGRPIRLQAENRALYHAAAVMSCGYVAALLKLAGELWEAVGLTREEALSALAPLTRSTVEGVVAKGFPDSVTGPIMRGDAETVEKHLQALAQRRPDVLQVYCHLGLASLSLARARGVARPERIQAMEDLLQHYASQGAPLRVS